MLRRMYKQHSGHGLTEDQDDLIQGTRISGFGKDIEPVGLFLLSIFYFPITAIPHFKS